MQEMVYKTILEQVEDGVYFVDLDRRITYWNAGAEQITGYSAEDVAGHSCSEGILPRHRRWIQPLHPRLPPGGGHG